MSLNIYGRTILLLRLQLRLMAQSLLPNVLVLWVVLYCFVCPHYVPTQPNVTCVSVLSILDCLFGFLKR